MVEVVSEVVVLVWVNKVVLFVVGVYLGWVGKVVGQVNVQKVNVVGYIIVVGIIRLYIIIQVQVDIVEGCIFF